MEEREAGLRGGDAGAASSVEESSRERRKDVLVVPNSSRDCRVDGREEGRLEEEEAVEEEEEEEEEVWAVVLREGG